MVPAPTASRSFAGPSEFPPSQFAGYGILAFPADPDRNAASRERFAIFCEAYLAALPTVEEQEAVGVSAAEQMVTVLPFRTEESASAAKSLERDETCAFAVSRYGLIAAQSAIREATGAAARTDGVTGLTGRGPYLLGWSPGRSKGERDSLVFVADLSDVVSAEQALSDMRIWADEIQLNPELWRDGWSVEGVRLALRRWVDRRAVGLLQLIGGVA